MYNIIQFIGAIISSFIWFFVIFGFVAFIISRGKKAAAKDSVASKMSGNKAGSSLDNKANQILSQIKEKGQEAYGKVSPKETLTQVKTRKSLISGVGRSKAVVLYGEQIRGIKR